MGEKPVGCFEVTFPADYINWLRDSSIQAYTEVAKSLFQRGCSVFINIEKLYSNISNLIINNIDDNEVVCFVVNDNFVTDDSALVVAIQRMLPNAVFKPFEEWGTNEAETSKGVSNGEKSEDASFKYLICRVSGEHVYELLNQDGSKVEGLGMVRMVDYLFRKFHRGVDEHSLPYVLCMNTADEKLYFISSKQILCLGDWSDGELCGADNLNKHKSITVNENFKGFFITDKYDYNTYYKVVNGICEETTKDIYGETVNKLPYYINYSGEEGMPLCISVKAEEPITIPGFKSCIYLGNNGKEDIFWAGKQGPSKESFIVNIEGGIIRNYEYYCAFTINGKYIANIDQNGICKAITDLDGKLKICCDLDASYFGDREYYRDYKDVESFNEEIYKFKDYSINHRLAPLFWLVKEAVICEDFNTHFYFLKKWGEREIYKRADKSLVGTYTDIYERGDGIYLVAFFDSDRYHQWGYMDENGKEIYRLDHNMGEMPTSRIIECDGRRADGATDKGRVAENRIIINVDNRYYKIIDYSGNEITRIDFGPIDECYHNGKLFYMTNSEFGYYDIMGKKNIVSNGVLREPSCLKTISDNLLFLDYSSKHYKIVDLEGKALLEGRNISFDSFYGKFIKVTDEEWNTTIYDFNCKKIASLTSGEDVFIIE